MTIIAIDYIESIQHAIDAAQNELGYNFEDDEIERLETFYGSDIYDLDGLWLAFVWYDDATLTLYIDEDSDEMLRMARFYRS